MHSEKEYWFVKIRQVKNGFVIQIHNHDYIFSTLDDIFEFLMTEFSEQ